MDVWCHLVAKNLSSVWFCPGVLCQCDTLPVWRVWKIMTPPPLLYGPLPAENNDHPLRGRTWLFILSEQKEPIITVPSVQSAVQGPRPSFLSAYLPQQPAYHQQRPFQILLPLYQFKSLILASGVVWGQTGIVFPIDCNDKTHEINIHSVKMKWVWGPMWGLGPKYNISPTSDPKFVIWKPVTFSTMSDNRTCTRFTFG